MDDPGTKSLMTTIVEAVKGNQTVAIILIVAVVILILAAMFFGQDLSWLPGVLGG